MQQFFLTMMCTNCKNKITDALREAGYKNFTIDMDSSLLTFQDYVNPFGVIRTVNNVGYKIELYEKNLDID